MTRIYTHVNRQINFKDWLLTEDGAVNDGGGENTGKTQDLLYPVQASDGVYELKSPISFWIWQWKLKKAQELGNILSNIDNEQQQNIKFLSLKSQTMPSNERWLHSPKKRGNIVPLKGDMVLLGVGKHTNKPEVIG